MAHERQTKLEAFIQFNGRARWFAEEESYNKTIIQHFNGWDTNKNVLSKQRLFNAKMGV
jgi:hypothetical protein